MVANFLLLSISKPAEEQKYSCQLPHVTDPAATGQQKPTSVCIFFLLFGFHITEI